MNTELSFPNPQSFEDGVQSWMSLCRKLPYCYIHEYLNKQEIAFTVDVHLYYGSVERQRYHEKTFQFIFHRGGKCTFWFGESDAERNRVKTTYIAQKATVGEDFSLRWEGTWDEGLDLIIEQIKWINEDSYIPLVPSLSINIIKTWTSTLWARLLRFI